MNTIPRLRIVPVILLIACWLAGPVLAASPVNLAPAFQEGQGARFKLWTLRQRSTSTTIQGRTQNLATQLEVNGESTWRVTRVHATGGATCELTFDWLTVAITMPDGSVQHCDSRQARGDNATVQTLIRAMAGPKLTFEINADGSVASVRGADAIRNAAGEVKAPDDLDWMETASELAVLPFGPAEATTGRTWSARFDWSHELGKMRHDTTYQLNGVEDVAGIPLANVSSTSRLRLDVDLSQRPADAPPVSIRMISGESTSQIMYDLSRHEAAGRNSIQTTRIQADVRVGENMIVSVTDETVQGQTLRIAEIDP